ncbi:autotransporter-associated N-terminal domain-containing protein, partial [uncultured Leptotrichia sp.]|uniref:autotransporter-associated N-terminal domain-containing protein n=1 Tax=uncultured Leptotrichia sp. TaxID=159271 RepID=UPI0025D15347
GLLTIAPKLHADVASEQQEITAQTYDAITDLRQSFMRARKENEKSLKGAQSELAQLLRQGDQVIKSPWSSFQFGTGYTNNDWGTTYRGRGGKFLEYYRRDNDLTKYVFDKDKHLYGATNLNMPRNQEPNSLTINPANIYKPYNPYTPEKLDNVYVPTAPNFEYDIRKPEGVSTYDFSYSMTQPVRSASTTVNQGQVENGIRNFNNRDFGYTTNNPTATPTATYAATVVVNAGGTTDVFSNYYYWWRSGSNAGKRIMTTSNINNNTFEIGGSARSYWTGWWNPYNYDWFSGFSTVTGGGSIGYAVDDTNSYTGLTLNGNISVENTTANYNDLRHKVALRYMSDNNTTYTDAYNWATAHIVSYHPEDGAGHIWTDRTYYYDNTGTYINKLTGVYNSGSSSFTGLSGSIISGASSGATSASNFYGTSVGNSVGRTPVLASVEAKESVTLNNNNFTIDNGSYNAATQRHIGLVVNGTNKTITLGDTTTTGNGNTFNVKGNGNIGIYVKDDTLDSHNSNITVGSANTHKENIGIKVDSSKTANSTLDKITIGGYTNNGIVSEGTLSIFGSDFDVNQNTPDGVTTRNNGIYASGGSVTIENASGITGTLPNGLTDYRTDFAITGSESNGIYLTKSGATGASLEIKDNHGGAKFSVGGSSNNGIYQNSDRTVKVYDSEFAVGGSTSNGIYASGNAAASSAITVNNTAFNISGTSSNGIYMAGNSPAPLTVEDGTVFKLTGNNENGIYVNGTGAVNISDTTFNVNETNKGSTTPPTTNNNNGIFVRDGKTVTSIKDSNFNVGYTGTGILLGNSNGTTNAKVTTIENTVFDVKNTNGSGTGIYLYNGNATLGKDAQIVGDSSDRLITISQNSGKDQSLTLEGAISHNRLTGLFATGNNNVGINIQEGYADGNHEGIVTITSGGTNKGWNLDFVGTGNVGIKNNRYAEDLKIKNLPGTLPTSTNIDGMMSIRGDSGVMFANLGYVNSGTLNLNYVEMQGQNSIVAAFVNNHYNTTTKVGKEGSTGIWKDAGDGIKLQGIIGGTGINPGAPSKYSVGVYADTGQRNGLKQSDYQVGVNFTTDSGNLKIDDLQIGLNSQADQSTLIYAKNGTVIDVLENDFSGALAKNISDGAQSLTTSGMKWGYNVDDAVVSDKSVIAYADGFFTGSKHGYSITSDGIGVTKIDFNADSSKKADIDMVSTRGTALLATGGGEINAVNVRAGGYESILAYANGKTSNATGSIADTPSTITINGNILAADNNLLGANNLNDGNVKNAHSGYKLSETYNNIGAVALNGGSILIKDAKRTTDAKEGKTGETKVDADISHSLIYGMAAYASGTGSSVKFDDSGTANTSGVTVVSGIYGALYAEKNGQIEFAGDIINENNMGINTGTSTTTGKATGVTTTVRKGRGIGTNDHENVTPFYVSRTVRQNSTTDNAAIVFNSKKTNIDMYDGILLTGNNYKYDKDTYNHDGITQYKTVRDYYGKTTAQTGENDQFNMAKYRGMENVKVAIMGDNSVKLGVVNQAEGLVWNDSGNTNTTFPSSGTANYLDSIGKNYGKGMTITNAQKSSGSPSTPVIVSTTGGSKVGNRFSSTLINSDLTVKKGNANTVISLEDLDKTDVGAVGSSVNDPFNDIKMESTLVTFEKDQKVIGDVAVGYRAGQGLNMANSLYRWDKPNEAKSTWRKTRNDESGYINNGLISVIGGTAKGNGATSADVNITGMNVAFGRAENREGGKVRIDHGYAIAGTDAPILLNAGDITVTGKYDPATKSQLRSTFVAETAPSGKNYGIIGISDTNIVGYNVDDNDHTVNEVTITHEKTGKIYVEGDLAVGIYAENRNDANAGKVNITYSNDTAGATGIDVSNANVSSVDAKGVGIALVNKNPNYVNGSATAGGIIKLKGDDNSTLSSSSFGSAGTAQDENDSTHLTLHMGKNDIYTGKNGIGIYGESAEIKLDSKKFTVETADNGVGLWATDDSTVGIGANHEKTFQYAYHGAKDKNGFAMAFTGKNTTHDTTAQNDLDIKFTNKADASNVNLVNESSRTGTNKGIAGILVNTDGANDTVINTGHIDEDKSSVTNLRAYGAVVNKGRFINKGNITLNDSLMPNQAKDVKSEDMKKANVGIFANRENSAGTEGGLLTYIENHGDITIGKDANSDKNIGSWAIYGYNVATGAKPDGTDSVITINKNSYGIYSGDGNVSMEHTKLKVGNDKVLGHVRHTYVDKDGNSHIINRQSQYAQDQNLLGGLDKPRELDSAIGVYIDKGASNTYRKLNLSADMDIDRFSYGIVMAEKNGGARTDVEIGSPTYAPTIRLAYSTNTNPGGHVKSVAPTTNPIIPLEVEEQGNSVYYYSADTESRGKTYANVTMDGDYNTAYYTKGSMDNYGTINLRSKYDVDNNNPDLGYGNVGIFSANPDAPSTNYGTITTSMSDTGNMKYSAGMAAGRNYFVDVETIDSTGKKVTTSKYDRTEEQGYIINRGNIVVQEKEGIGMFATGSRSRAINYGNIELKGENGIGMYLDRGAIGENYGTIKGNAQNLKGVVAINGGYIKNYGTIDVTGTGSVGIITDGSKFIVDANGNPTEVLSSKDPRYNTSAATTAVQNNGGNSGTDLYGGTESSIEEGTSGNPKTTGVGTTITMPDIAPLTEITVDGINTPIFNVETDASIPTPTNPGWGENINVTSSIQTGGTRIIDLSQLDEWGNRLWRNYHTDQLSEVTSVGMYVDTSGVKYTNPINGLNNLPKLGKVNLYFGTEATMYTNAKAIRLGEKMIRPFNDALSNLPGGATVNPLSASLTWQVAAKLNDNNQLTDVYLSKVPYHSFAFDNDKSLYNFANNLDNIYEIAEPHSAEKVIFNKLNSLGNGEGHILAQAFDQMRGHIYGGVQQRIKATSDVLGGEINGLRNDRNVSKDSNKFKAFGQRNEFKTDTAGMPDWYSNAGGVAFVHEDETVRLGQSSGWSAGVVNNYFTFKDLSKSYENQA